MRFPITVVSLALAAAGLQTGPSVVAAGQTGPSVVAAVQTGPSVVAAGLQTGPSEASGDWPMYSHSLSGQRYSPLTQISTANVAGLAPAWSLRLTTPAAGGRGG